MVVVHQIPGRVRLRVPALYHNEMEGLRFAECLKGAEGIRSVHASTLTGSAIIEYDPPISMDSILARLKTSGYVLEPSEHTVAHIARTLFALFMLMIDDIILYFLFRVILPRWV